MKVFRNVCFYVFITCMLLFVQEARSTDNGGEEDQESKRKDEASQSDSDNKSKKQADSGSNIKTPENWEKAQETTKEAAEKREELFVLCFVNYDLNPQTDTIIKDLATTCSDKTFIVLDENKMFVEGIDTNGIKKTEKVFTLNQDGLPVFVVHKFSHRTGHIFNEDNEYVKNFIKEVDQVDDDKFYVQYSEDYKIKHRIAVAAEASEAAKEEEKEGEDGENEEVNGGGKHEEN